MELGKPGIVERTFLYHDAQVIFACMVAAESNKKKPDYRKLAGVAMQAARAFQAEAAAQGQFSVRPVA